MVSKGSSQNMGVFGIVNSHEARLMKPLGKPQKRSYSMPGKTSYPQSPWCLQYLAVDFQQQIWDEWSTPTIVFGMGWSHQPRPQNIPHGTRWLVHDFPAEEYEICWWVFQSVVSGYQFVWLSWQAYQQSPSVFGCFPPFNPTEIHYSPRKIPEARIPLGCHRKGWNDLETYQVLLGMGICLRNLNNVGTKRVSKNKPPPSTVGGLLNIFKYIYIFREREIIYIYLYRLSQVGPCPRTNQTFGTWIFHLLMFRLSPCSIEYHKIQAFLAQINASRLDSYRRRFPAHATHAFRLPGMSMHTTQEWAQSAHHNM